MPSKDLYRTVAVAVAATVLGRIAWAVLGGQETAENVANEVRLRL